MQEDINEPRSKPPQNLKSGKASGKQKEKKKHTHLETLLSAKKKKNTMCLNKLLICCSINLCHVWNHFWGFKDKLKARHPASMVLRSDRQAKRMLSVAKILRCQNERAPPRSAPVMTHWLWWCTENTSVMFSFIYSSIHRRWLAETLNHSLFMVMNGRRKKRPCCFCF